MLAPLADTNLALLVKVSELVDNLRRGLWPYVINSGLRVVDLLEQVGSVVANNLLRRSGEARVAQLDHLCNVAQVVCLEVLAHLRHDIQVRKSIRFNASRKLSEQFRTLFDLIDSHSFAFGYLLNLRRQPAFFAAEEKRLSHVIAQARCHRKFVQAGQVNDSGLCCNVVDRVVGQTVAIRQDETSALVEVTVKVADVVPHLQTGARRPHRLAVSGRRSGEQHLIRRRIGKRNKELRRAFRLAGRELSFVDRRSLASDVPWLQRNRIKDIENPARHRIDTDGRVDLGSTIGGDIGVVQNKNIPRYEHLDILVELLECEDRVVCERAADHIAFAVSVHRKRSFAALHVLIPHNDFVAVDWIRSCFRLNERVQFFDTLEKIFVLSGNVRVRVGRVS